ncbi:hypothetical protein VC178_01530 [Polynucleobacter sp. AP-Sanab-80-C2]|uniref:hypothetical protein n=1 Tax=Polynucleobacter sp. AP-Sanab-80-C2 TaxID=3108274 RepID=UPI002B2224B5|nr:hypothetical protein [Polynucleobacter sp. AP-Sanab-80-C2]MEA9598575.1 hypothetical protein [Polynucleobacter sp. AP-Sanab-80-C2]
MPSETPQAPETVFIIHHGSQDYLRVAAHFVKKFGNHAILIGDDSVTGSMCDQYYDDSQIDLPNYATFVHNYVHMSSATREFELLCFKRYFFLYEIAKSQSLHHFWMIDSDLILLSDLKRVVTHPLFRECIAAFSTPYQDEMALASSPHCSYWTLQGLESFIQFLGKMYQGETRKSLDKKYAHHQKYSLPGGICDMTALYLWQKNNSRVVNLADVHFHGLPLFDNNINHDGNMHAKEFKMIRRVNLKKVTGNFPQFFAHSISSQTPIPLACLHFQGKAKSYMKHFMHNEAISYSVYFIEIAQLYIKRRIQSLKRILSFKSQ